MQAKVFVN